jgi:hypothetical protein
VVEFVQAILTSRAKSLPVLHEIMPLANGNCGKVKRSQTCPLLSAAN